MEPNIRHGETWPYYVVWGITNICNARCIHCYANAGNKLPSEIETSEGLNLIDEFSDIGLLMLGFSGGEPILRRDFFILAEYARNRGIQIAISTNGLGLSREVIEKLKSLGIARVQISLDGASSKIHDYIRGVPGTFDAAIKAAKMCKEEGIQLVIGITPMVHNVAEIPGILNLAVGLGADVCNLSIYVPTGRGQRELDLPSNKWQSLLSYWFKKRKELAGQIVVAAHDPRLVLVDNVIDFMSGFSGCQAGISHCHITADGFVTPCVMMDLKVGNIRESSFKDIWTNSTDLINLRNRDLLKGKCQTCKHRDLCGGCRAVPYAYSGDYLDEDPRCWYNPIKGDIQ